VSGIFTNPKQLEEWVEAAQRIQKRYGIGKALGYLIGEKFYTLVKTMHTSRKIIRAIDDERKKPDFNPVLVTKYKDSVLVTNLAETISDEKTRVIEAEGLLVKFTFLINGAFSPLEIRKYFESHPSLGVHGHVASEEQFEFMVSKGAIKHSIETEVEDALIFGEMMRYFGIDV
jgi:hypothetical protein